MTSLRFIGDVPLWAGLLLALIVCALAWRYYRNESFELSNRLRWLLPLLRSLAFLMGILMLTGPVLHHRSVTGELGNVQIYVDSSQSMTLTDQHLSPGRKLLIAEQQGWLEPGTVEADDVEQQAQQLIDSGDLLVQAALTMADESTRWRRVERSLLETPNALVAELKQFHNVEVLALHNADAVSILNEQDTPDATAEFSATPMAATSDLASGVTATQRTAARSETTSAEPPPGTPTIRSAIVLLTDGQHNSGPSPLQMARVLGSQGVAFFPVALGADQHAADVAVTGVEHPDVVFQKDRVRGTVIINDNMPAGQSLLASVMHDGKVLWQKQLATEGSGERRIEFEFQIDELIERLGQQFASDVQQHAVPLSLTASVAPSLDDFEATNNQRSFRLAAITDNYRLLIIDGRSRWETRYLRNVFDRDTQWNVNVIIAGPGTDDKTLPHGTNTGQFPETREALFDYDLIIFGEVDPSIFAEHEFTWLKEFVETRGGGMVLLDGNRGRMQQFTDRTLRPLLPVEFPEANGVTTSVTSLQLTDTGRNVPALSFEVDPQANEQFWRLLPPPRRINQATALPGAEVLVEAVVGASRPNGIRDATAGSPSHLPMLVTRSYGAGRVLYLACDETWRWRYKAADTYHQRIWNQLATYVIPRPFTSSDEYLSVDTGPVSYGNGHSAAIRIRLLGLDGKPATDATVDALLWKDGRMMSTASLTADSDVPGIYRGTTGPLDEGEYEVSVRASGFSQEALRARGQFVVLPPETGELQNTSANEELLQQMATASGGVFLREEQIGRLPALLSPLSNGRVEESDSSLFENSTFSYTWFSAIILLLATEWFLRKRAGLL